MDRVALMAYDEHGPTWNGVGPIGGLPWQESCLQQMLAQVPAAKVDLGVAGYGYTWPKQRYRGPGQRRAGPADGECDGSTATWDSTQGEWTVTLKNGTVMWWSDAKSWPLRAALAQKYAAHGMALWSLGLSDPLKATRAGQRLLGGDSPASGSVTAGGSATSTITTAVTSGSSAVGGAEGVRAPTGASASFSPSLGDRGFVRRR